MFNVTGVLDSSIKTTGTLLSTSTGGSLLIARILTGMVKFSELPAGSETLILTLYNVAMEELAEKSIKRTPASVTLNRLVLSTENTSKLGSVSGSVTLRVPSIAGAGISSSISKRYGPRNIGGLSSSSTTLTVTLELLLNEGWPASVAIRCT